MQQRPEPVLPIDSSFLSSSFPRRMLYPHFSRVTVFGRAKWQNGARLSDLGDAAFRRKFLKLQHVVAGHNAVGGARQLDQDRKSTRLNSSHVEISYAVFCLKKKKNNTQPQTSIKISTTWQSANSTP